ncbi:hypothetical protein AX14_013366 [Amanita brunnescens Koide BX004]|nr:hypothetical protein AX14_013366 [Amanita brunnescens Koide BX004]
MPLYQVLCIAAHYPDYQYIKQLVQQTATHVMHRGGVVRAIVSQGTRTLPQRMQKKGQRNVFHKRGDYWTMHFDTSPRTLQSLNDLMKQDARVLRWTILKLGTNVEDVATKGQQNIGIPDVV